VELEETISQKNIKKEASILLTLSLVFTISLTIFIYFWWRHNLPLVSPLDLIENITHIPSKENSKQKIVLGFLPYWNLKYTDQIPIKNLTHLAYFGIDLEEDGTIKKYENPGELEPGWNKLNSQDYEILKRQMKILGKKNIILVRGMSNDLIKSIINNSNTRQIAINEILEVYKTKQFDGLNIDFEPTGFLDKQTQDNFTIFIREISTQCKAINSCEFSIDIYAKSAVERRLYDLKELDPYLDYVIIMAYDFFTPSSTTAGPIAPLSGACQSNIDGSCLEYDIQTSIVDISKIIQKDKLILGVPFYGYEWQTISDKFLSNTYKGTGSLATFRRVQELLENEGEASVTASWSATSLSPYLIIKKGDQINQIHYENERSLRLKLEFINNTGLSGLAIWALGYDTPYMDFWETINQFFK
jgi:spore germination protein YaaH